MPRIQTVGKVSEFIQNGTIGANTFQTHSTGLLDFIVHPLDTLTKLGAEKTYDIIEPTITTIGVIATPITTLIIYASALLIAFQMKEKASSWILKSGITYIVIQLLPIIIKSCLQII